MKQLFNNYKKKKTHYTKVWDRKRRVVYPSPRFSRWNLGRHNWKWNWVRTPGLIISLFYGLGLKTTESNKSFSTDVTRVWIRSYIIILNVNGQDFGFTPYPERQVALSCSSSQHCDWELFNKKADKCTT